jgi:hypothetical protein
MPPATWILSSSDCGFVYPHFLGYNLQMALFEWQVKGLLAGEPPPAKLTALLRCILLVESSDRNLLDIRLPDRCPQSYPQIPGFG